MSSAGTRCVDRQPKPSSMRSEPEPLSLRRRWLVQAAVGLGTIITTFDTSSLNVSLATLAREFAVDASTVAWLPLLGFLVVTSTLLLFGRLSDLLGSKVVFVGGFVVYGIASLLCGLATGIEQLLVFRGTQALGVSMLSANAMAILAACFPAHQRGMAVGVASTVVGLGYFVAPVIAGFLIVALGWRYVFLAGVPISLLGLAVGLLVLPRGARTKGLRFDFLGALFFATSATALLLAINAAKSATLTAPPVLGLVGLAGLAVALFVAVERRVREPMLELGLFRIRLFAFSLASAFLFFVGIAGQELLVPLFIQQVLRESPATAGLAMSIVPFLRMLLSSPSGYLSDRFGPRWLASTGAALAALGLSGLSRMDAGTPLLWLVGCLAVVGLGTGLFFSPNMHATMAAVPPDRLGVGSGALGLRRNLGQSLGVALAAYLLQAGSGSQSAVVGSFQISFAVQSSAVGLAVVAAVLGGSGIVARRAQTAARGAGRQI